MVINDSTKKTDSIKLLNQPLLVTEVKDVATGTRKDGKGEFQRLNFKGKVGDNPEHWYTTFDASLFPVIKDNLRKIINCDITEKETDQGTVRYVFQVYVDGKPVADKSKGNRKSAADYEADRLSNEKRTAVDNITTLELAGKLDKVLGNQLVELRNKWLLEVMLK